jgi:hypothetical protein
MIGTGLAVAHTGQTGGASRMDRYSNAVEVCGPIRIRPVRDSAKGVAPRA